MNDRINEKISVFRLKTFRIEHNAYNAIKAHEDILHAIKERDAQIGEIFVLRHLELIEMCIRDSYWSGYFRQYRLQSLCIFYFLRQKC